MDERVNQYKGADPFEGLIMVPFGEPSPCAGTFVGGQMDWLGHGYWLLKPDPERWIDRVARGEGCA